MCVLYMRRFFGRALSTSPSVCTNGSYLHVSTTDYWGLARQGESGNGEDCALVAELAREEVDREKRLKLRV